MEYCEICGKYLTEQQQKRKAKFCSNDCRARHYRERYWGMNPKKLKLPTSTVGAISELRAASDLLGKGYHVFRALSPACPCDIAVLKDGKLLRIEVKTGYRTATGKLYKSPAHNNEFDILAMVLPDEIIYEPPLE